MIIGKKIRKIRTQQKRTLQQISDTCGFTKGLLSKIENSKINPSVATLSKIAGALGVKVSALLEEDDGLSVIYTPIDKVKEKNFIKTEKGYSFFPFASEHIDKKMQPFLFTAKKGEIIKHELSHEGEEFIYVLEGEMKFKVGDIEYWLKPGDSLYFDSTEEHGVEPLSDMVKYIDIFTG